MPASTPARRFRVSTQLLALVTGLGCGATTPPPARPSSYLVVWAGPNMDEATPTAGRHPAGPPDVVAVFDADTASARYGALLATKDVGVPGAMAHHTELTLPARHPLFTSDFMTGQIFLIDASDPLAPKVTGRIDSIPGYRRPHSFARLANGNVLVAMQNGNGKLAGDPGGLVELGPEGRVLRSSSAADPNFPGARIRPNGVELLPAIDRIVTTSMPMDDEVTADVVQIWRLSDLRLLHTLAVPALAGKTGNSFPYDSRVLADGRTVMMNTYYCGFYRLSGIETEQPRLDLVHALHEPHAEGCAVAVVMGHYWIVPAAFARTIISLDVTDPAHPVEVSRLRTRFDVLSALAVGRSGERPHRRRERGRWGAARARRATWIARRGKLTWDERFRDAGSSRLGVDLDRPELRRGSGVARHGSRGTVRSRCGGALNTQRVAAPHRSPIAADRAGVSRGGSAFTSVRKAASNSLSSVPSRDTESPRSRISPSRRR